MVKCSVPGPGSDAVGRPAYTESDIDDMEKATLEKANKALSAIENALAVWESSKEKPEELQLRVNSLRRFYEALAAWEKKMLKAMARKEELDARIGLLREFSDICYLYA